MDAEPKIPGTQAVSPSQEGPKLPRWAAALMVAGLLLGVGLLLVSVYVDNRIPDPQEMIVLGQSELTEGSPAGVRVVVRMRQTRMPVSGATVTMRLEGKKGTFTDWGTFRTDAAGSITNMFEVPTGPIGEHRLVVEATSRYGEDRVERTVKIRPATTLHLTSDKPLYQPGQTIHLRAMGLNGRTQKPLAQRTVTFEVSDGKGNKVFKETKVLSAFGIASADFVLADQLNEGNFTIRAVSAEATTEREVEVKRYVLPKFKVRVATDQNYYQPAQTVNGTVQADYFFGRPVVRGSVEVSLTVQGTGSVRKVTGTTDANGKFAFRFAVPPVAASTNGPPMFQLETTVRDTGNHAEVASLILPISDWQFTLQVIPEAGEVIRGVENILYVLAAYPDGSPVQGSVEFAGKKFPLDAQGVAELALSTGFGDVKATIKAVDVKGAQVVVSKMFTLPDAATPPVMLRSDRAVYRHGEVPQLTVLRGEAANILFLDVIKDGQTVLTRTLPVQNGPIRLPLPLPPNVTGALSLHIYAIGEDGDDRGCARTIYVHPATALKITSKLDKTVYRPGETAHLELAVTDAKGKAQPSALGVVAVDESVFALKGPGTGMTQQFAESAMQLLQARPEFQQLPRDFARWLDPAGNQNYAKACLAAFSVRPVNPVLEELLREGTLDKRYLARIRATRGTPAFENLRRRPDYADAIQMLENGHGWYSLRETTGDAKANKVKLQREAYYKGLQTAAGLAVIGLLILTPALLAFYHMRLKTGSDETAQMKAENAAYFTLARGTYNLLSVLALGPVFIYPMGALMMEGLQRGSAGSLLGLEVLVFAFSTWQLSQRLREGEAKGLRPEMEGLRQCLWWFAALFIGSRAVVAATILGHGEGEVVVLEIILGFLAPLFVIFQTSNEIRSQFAERGIDRSVSRSRLVEMLALIAIAFILAGMLMPALAKAKAKSTTVALMSMMRQAGLVAQQAVSVGLETAGVEPPRIRRDFPETLAWRPEIITDDQGKASLEIPLADSITTWRTTVDAVSAQGFMGAGEVAIPVFQDFFVDFDLPVNLSLGDEISLPVVCHNYLKEPQSIRLALAGAGAFELAQTNLVVTLAAEEVKSVTFPVRAMHVGKQLLRITAQGSRTGDAVEREVRVVPTGVAVESLQNETFQDTFATTFELPSEAIPGSENLALKFYPSRFSEVVEGLDGIFQAPYGCFEQTSSTTYPNVLVLDYLKRMKLLIPAVEKKARAYINQGYQRLLTFEVPGGGFDWYGRAPANVWLSAYGLLEFSDMKWVHPVDPAVIERTRKWLFSQQAADGSWSGNESGRRVVPHAEITAYVAWALAESGDSSPELDRALNYLTAHRSELNTPYLMALAAGALAERRPEEGKKLLEELKGLAMTDGSTMVHWVSHGRGLTHSHGYYFSVDTTALTASALRKAGRWPDLSSAALRWISAQKKKHGTWGSTQSTILAMRALLQGTEPGSKGVENEIGVTVNDQAVTTVKINEKNRDVMQLVELTVRLRPGSNRIELKQRPAGAQLFQLTGGYWLPKSSAIATAPADKTLEIDVSYARASVPVNQNLDCRVVVKNLVPEPVDMPLVTLRIPPGFEADASGLNELVNRGKIDKIEMSAGDVVIYLRSLAAGEPFEFTYVLRARHPQKVSAPPGVVYEYYQPSNRAESAPVTLQVTAD